jgi:hypothetical protein
MADPDKTPAEASNFVADMTRRFKQEMEDRSEMHLQVGRAIVTLSEIEGFLAAFFALFSLPMKEEETAGMFYAAQNFNQRLELVDYAVDRSPEIELKKEWATLSARIRQQKFVRNITAHASIEYTQRKDAGSTIVIAQSKGGDSKRKELTINDVRKAADELADIYRQLRMYLNKCIRVIVKSRNIPLDDL